VIDRFNPGKKRFAEAPQDRGRFRDGAGDNLAHRLVGRVRSDGAATIGDELIEIEHYRPSRSSDGA
jgi:hypothetical protein